MKSNSLRIIGIDWGEARIGVAVSDDMGMMAHPLETIPAKTKPLDRIAALVAERKAEVIVVGLPRNMDGTYGSSAEKVRAFVETLKARVPECRVLTWDERLTTVSAERALREAGRNAKQQRSVIDQAAAQIILQSWLDSQACG